MVPAERPPGPVEVEPQVEPEAVTVRARPVLPPGRRVEHHPAARRDPQPAPDGVRPARVGAGQHVVARVAGLQDLAPVAEGPAQDRGGEGAGGEQQAPVRGLPVEGREVAVVGEPGVVDVVGDPLEQGAVPGLHDDLAGAPAQEVREVGVADEVAAGGQRPVPLGAPDPDGADPGRQLGLGVVDHPQVFQRRAPAGEFGVHGAR